MFCCVRTRGSRERKVDHQPAAANAKAQPPQPKSYEKSTGNGLKDGNMVVLSGAGAAVAATAVATVAVVGVNDSATSQGCCCGGGDGGGGGGCGGGGCGGGGCGGCGG